MAGNGRRCRSRWDYAADVAQTVRAAAASSKDLRSRRHVGGSNGVTEIGADVTRWHERCGTAKLRSTAGGNWRSPNV